MYTIRLSKAIPKTEYFQYAITFICWLNNEKGSNEIKNHEIEEEEVKNQSLCIICDRFLCVCQCVDCVVQYTIHADTELANKSHDIHRKQFQVFRLLSNKTQEKNQFHRQKCSSTTFVELKKVVMVKIANETVAAPSNRQSANFNGTVTTFTFHVISDNFPVLAFASPT